MDADVDHSHGLMSHRDNADQVLAALGTDARAGLSRRKAQLRLQRFGRNELTAEQLVPTWRKFLAQSTDVLVVLLLLAAFISAGLWFYEREAALPYEAEGLLQALPCAVHPLRLGGNPRPLPLDKGSERRRDRPLALQTRAAPQKPPGSRHRG